MSGKWAVPVIVSILILGTLGTSHAFAQLCPLTGCLTDKLYVGDYGLKTVGQYDSDGNLLNANFVTGLKLPQSIAFDFTITPMLASLSLLNFVDINSDAEMLGFGIGIISLNVGMYFVGPTLAGISLKKIYDKKRYCTTKLRV